jgi:hypothetical protein
VIARSPTFAHSDFSMQKIVLPFFLLFFHDSHRCSRRRVQHQASEAPVKASNRFSVLRATDSQDLKLSGLLSDTYEVHMLDSDVKCELLEFGLVGGPQPYPNDALWKVPHW